MNEFYKNVYPEDIKVEKKKKPERKAAGAGNKEKELTPIEKYFINTSVDKALVLLKKNPNPDRVRIRGRGSLILEELKNNEVIEVRGREMQIHRENLPKLFNETTGAGIVDLYKKNPEITVESISNILRTHRSTVYKEIKRLCKSGLLENSGKGNRIRISVTQYSERIYISPVKLSVELTNEGRKKRCGKEEREKNAEIDDMILGLLKPGEAEYEETVFGRLEGDVPRKTVKTRVCFLKKKGLLIRSAVYKDGEIMKKVEKIIQEEKK